jgi:TetR/AcrR family transcriptional regulator, transcriptional repressor for nem operon
MRNPEETREKILKKSGILFNTQGYRATSISDITESTGFTKGAVYRHFDNKEELEKQALYHLSSVMFDSLRDVIKAQPTAGQKLRAMCRYFESYLDTTSIKGGCPLLNAAIEADDSHPTLRKAAIKILDILHNSFVLILEKGIKYKQIRADIDKDYYASVFIAALEGAIMMSKLRGNNKDVKRVVEHLEKQIAAIEC